MARTLRQPTRAARRYSDHCRALRDISVRKDIEDKLRQAGVVYSTIAEGIMMLDDHGRITSVNPAFCQMTGYQLGESEGKMPEEFLIVRQNKILIIVRSRHQSGNWNNEGVCKCSDGRIFNALQQVCRSRRAGQLYNLFIPFLISVQFAPPKNNWCTWRIMIL